MGRPLSRIMVMWYWSADTLFWQLSIDGNMQVQHQVPGSRSNQVWNFTKVTFK